MTGDEFQALVWKAESGAYGEFFDRVWKLPRWRRWLYYKVAPAFPPCVIDVPPCVIEVTKPIELNAPRTTVQGALDCQMTGQLPSE